MMIISGENSYAGISDRPALRLQSGFTIECWAKLDGINVQTGIIDKGSATRTIYGLFVDSGKIVGQIYSSTVFSLSHPIPDGDWHHYALVFSPGDSLYLYVDASRVAARAVSSSPLTASTDSLRIGVGASRSSFQGEIDEVRFWNVAHSRSTITALMPRSLNGSEAGLVAYYSFDDDPGSSVAHDFTSHGANAALSGSSVTIAPSSSLITMPTPGYRLDALEKSVDFGTRRCTPYFDTIIHVRNLSGQALQVNSVAPYRGQAFSVTSDLPFTLDPDSTKYFSIKIHFSPSAGGVYDDSLYISSGDNCGGTLRVGLHAVYDSVGIAVSPATIAIGSKLQCEFPILRTITLENTSTTDSVKIASATLPNGIALMTPLPIRLARGERRQVQIRIDSGARGGFNLNALLALDKCSREASLNVTGVRTLAALAVPPLVNFGTFPASVTGVTIDTVIVVQNVGDTGMQVTSLYSSNPALQITEPRPNEFLDPGDTLQVRVQLRATDCGVTEGALHIRGFYCALDTATVLRVTLRPPAQLLSRTVNAGVTCNYIDTTLWIANANSVSMRVDTMTFDQDGIFFVLPYTFPFTIAPHDSARINIRFNPGFNGDYGVTGSIHGTPCSITPVHLFGSKGINKVNFELPQLNFGRGCDLTPVRQSIMLVNSSPRTVTIADTVLSGSARFHVDPLSLPLVLPAGGAAVISVRYSPVIGRLDTATFVVIAAEGCTAATLRLRGSREHPLVALLDRSIDFDTICTPSSALRYLHLQNGGLDTADLGAIGTAAGFSVVSGPTLIAAGRTDSILIRFSPTLPQYYAGRVPIPIGSCGDTLFADVTGSGGPLPSLAASVDTLDFGRVVLGDSLVQCLTITNSSCVPIVIRPTDYSTNSGVFRINPGSKSDTVSRGRSTFVCVTFIPNSRGPFEDSLRIADGASDIATVILKGEGVAPLITYSTTSLDFGFVLHGDHKALAVKATNVGNSTAHLQYSTTEAVFAASGPDSLLPGSSDSIRVAFDPDASTAGISALALVRYDGFVDTLDLEGHGSERGLQVSASEGSFGAVHVMKDSVRRFAITAIADFPTVIDSVSVTPSNSPFITTWETGFPASLNSEQDTVWLTASYSPTEETADVGHVLLYSKSRVTDFQLRGTGVSEHIQLNATAIDLGDVELGTSKTLPRITISNTGGYPLTINSARISEFSISPDPSGEAIAPDASQPIDVTFTPTRARKVTDTLAIESSAPEGAQRVVLTGRGVYPVASRPKFSYSVGSATIRSGDIAILPVAIDGSFIEHIDADSTVLSIGFDPQMLRIRSVSATDLRDWHLLSDTAIRIVLNGAPTVAGQLCTLTTEALLGPHPISYVSVIDAEPRSDLAPLSADGTFTVTDCDGSLHGVGFAAEYGVQQSSPNPASDNTVLSYQLGLRGDVRVDIYNSVGQLTRFVDLGEQSAGHHETTVTLEGMPPGKYTYRIKSLDFVGEGTFLIVR